MSSDLPTACAELDQYVGLSGESNNIDAKGPMAWDGGSASARLARHIVAFANSRDGGVIVIGKSETDSGGFELDGLTDEQARSFDTTQVAKWVNSRFSPPVNLICHQHNHQDMRFVVITIEEFSDVPILCTKGFQDPNDNNKHILRERTIYIRNAQAESAPIETVEEMRELIGIATKKRRDEMLAMLDSLLKGKPLVAEPTDSERFGEELKIIEDGLGQSYAEQVKAGGWWMLIRPNRFDEAKWDNSELLEAIIQRRAFRLIDSFPAWLNGTHVREWGIANDEYGETWTLSKSGQFVCIRPYLENTYEYQCSWVPPDPNIAPGKWLEFTANLRRIFEMIVFAARFVEEYGPGERVELVLRATALSGRKLVTSSMTVLIRYPQECRAAQFEFKKVLLVEELRAEWEELAAEAMKRFAEFFPSQGGPVALETMRGWVKKFKTRDFV